MKKTLTLSAAGGAAVIGVVALALALVFVFSLPVAWLLMVLIGVLHSWAPVVPAVGFWVTWLGYLIVQIATAKASTTVTK